MPDSLGDRMKKYENIWRFYLPIRMPLIIRIDGKAFHSLTRKFDKPFDQNFINAMEKTTLSLCENIEGCKLAYTQSDEISLLLTDYENFDTQAWFQKNLQKIVSVSASIATLAFSKFIDGGLFDSRAFVLSKEEVVNYFIWRQQDATRNAIQGLGQANFSHKQLMNKSCDEIQCMLLEQKNINFNDLPITHKRGTCCIKEYYEYNNSKRTRWISDWEIPIFTENREYIEKFIQ